MVDYLDSQLQIEQTDILSTKNITEIQEKLQSGDIDLFTGSTSVFRESFIELHKTAISQTTRTYFILISPDLSKTHLPCFTLDQLMPVRSAIVIGCEVTMRPFSKGY